VTIPPSPPVLARSSIVLPPYYAPISLALTDDDIKIIKGPIFINKEYINFIGSDPIKRILGDYFRNNCDDVNTVIELLKIMAPESATLLLDKLGSRDFYCKDAHIKRRKYVEKIGRERLSYISITKNTLNLNKEKKAKIDKEIDKLKAQIMEKEKQSKELDVDPVHFSNLDPKSIISQN
jgi:hypothetical protein